LLKPQFPLSQRVPPRRHGLPAENSLVRAKADFGVNGRRRIFTSDRNFGASLSLPAPWSRPW